MIDPRYMSATDWCAATALALATLETPPKLHREESWQEWALAIIQTPSLASFAPPDPRYFTDWRSWAERFVECVPL